MPLTSKCAANVAQRSLQQLTLCLTVLLLLYPLATPMPTQTTIAQCEEINCPPANCSNPIRLDGECCPICIAPGELKN